MSGLPVDASADDDWETADFSNISQSKPMSKLRTTSNPKASEKVDTTITEDMHDQALNLRPGAPTFQPRLAKPPAPKLWEPNPPTAPSSSSKTTSEQMKSVHNQRGTSRGILQPPGSLLSGKDTIDSSNASSSRGSEAGSSSEPTDSQSGQEKTAQQAEGVMNSTPVLLKRTIQVGTPKAEHSKTGTQASDSPFGDDEDWNRDPTANNEPNAKVWEDANTATTSEAPALPMNGPPMPPNASLRILRRPSPATSASSSTANSAIGGTAPGRTGLSAPSVGTPGSSSSRPDSRRGKTLTEREEDYKRARERIFGKAEDTTEDCSPADNRSEASVCGSTSGAVTPARSVSSASSLTSSTQGAGKSLAYGGSTNPSSGADSRDLSGRSRGGPTTSSKRRGESHFEPLRPPSGSNCPDPTFSRNLNRDVSGLWNSNSNSATLMSPTGYAPMPSMYPPQPSPYDSPGAGYGMGMAPGMPYMGTQQQQQQLFAGATQGYGQTQPPFSQQPGQPWVGQQQPQQQSQPGYNRPLMAYHTLNNGGPSMQQQPGSNPTGPVRQPMGPGDMDHVGFNLSQMTIRAQDGPSQGGNPSFPVLSGQERGPGRWPNSANSSNMGASRPAYSSSSSSAGSDFGGSTGAGSNYSPFMNHNMGVYTQERITPGGLAPPLQQHVHPSNQQHHSYQPQLQNTHSYQQQPGGVGPGYSHNTKGHHRPNPMEHNSNQPSAQRSTSGRSGIGGPALFGGSGQMWHASQQRSGASPSIGDKSGSTGAAASGFGSRQ